jgi:hypothetical protein
MFPSGYDGSQDSQEAFPIDEMRRRQMLSGIYNDDAAEGQVKPDNSQAVSGQMTPAESKYQQVMGAAPNPQNYKPSVLRRIGAALAGAGAGWRNPEQGVQVANQINNQSYQRALNAWQQQAQQAQSGLKLDESVQNRQNAQARAAAAQTSADARMKAAQADEAWRQSQQQNQPWHPSTMDEAIQFEQSKQRPEKPSDFEQFQKDPDAYSSFLKAKEGDKETEADREKLAGMRETAENQREGMRQAGENSRSQARLASEQKAAKTISPEQQDVADDLAVQQALRVRPEYSGFVKNGRVIGVGELPQPHWYNSTSAAQSSLARTQYQAFLAEIQRQKKVIMGQDPNGGWTLTKHEDQ